VYHLEQFVNDFFPYSQKQLGFDKPVTIRFESDDDNASRMLGKTAYYDPTNMEVALYVDGRHPKDVMRSLSHELVHHAQNCRGDFTDNSETYEGYAQADPHLRKMEREAYTKGNLIFRDYEDLIKTGKKDVDIDFTKSGEPKMSLKEWKNNEINSKLMKKWGLLKEDSGAEERRHAEDNIRDDKKHIKNLKRDIKDDESELEEGWGWRDEDDEKRLEEFGSGTGYRNDDDSKEHDDEEGNRPSMAKDLELEEGDPLMKFTPQGHRMTDTSSPERLAYEEDPAAHMSTAEAEKLGLTKAEIGAAIGSEEWRRPPYKTGDPGQGPSRRKWRKAFAGQFKEGKISVREAKEITRRIIERIRKEGK
jgi:hypothetical protein